jgi:O-antigen ligase
VRPRLRDRLRHPGDARRRGAPRGLEGRLTLLAPLTRRTGFERAAFGFFLLGLGCVPSIAVANIALALCAGCSIAWRIGERRRGDDLLGPFRRPSPLKGPIGAFVLLSIGSCVFSTLPSRSLPQVKGLGTFALVVFAVALLRDRDDVALLLALWRGTTVYLVLRGVLEWTAGSQSTAARITGGLSVYMTYAELLMSFALLFAALALQEGRDARARLVDALLSAGAAAGVALSLTRSAYLGLAVGLGLLLAMLRPRLLVVLPFAAAALALFVPASVKARAASSFDRRDPTFQDRLLMWRAGLQMIEDRPLFGLGPKRVKDLYPVYRRPGWALPNPGHLHSNVVTIAAETGVPSLIAYLAFVLAFFVHAWRRARRASDAGERSVVCGAIAVMAALFVSGFFEASFDDVEVLMTTLVVASLPFALAPVESPGVSGPPETAPMKGSDVVP